MYAWSACSSETVIFTLIFMPFYSWKTDIFKSDKIHLSHVSFRIQEHAGTRRAVTSRSQTGEISLMWSYFSSCLHFWFTKWDVSGRLWNWQNNLFNSQPRFDSAMQIDSMGGQSQWKKSRGYIQVLQMEFTEKKDCVVVHDWACFFRHGWWWWGSFSHQEGCFKILDSCCKFKFITSLKHVIALLVCYCPLLLSLWKQEETRVPVSRHRKWDRLKRIVRILSVGGVSVFTGLVCSGIARGFSFPEHKCGHVLISNLSVSCHVLSTGQTGSPPPPTAFFPLLSS